MMRAGALGLAVSAGVPNVKYAVVLATIVMLTMYNHHIAITIMLL